jgi:hypothetical protein
MNKIAGLFAALALLLYGAAPSFAKKALDEGDLDRITAAGEPTIIQVSGVDVESHGEVDFEISYEDANSDSVAIEGGTTDINGGQQNLRALVVNNIAGESLAANALNIVSASAQNSAPGAQSNTITQSWGSVKITDVVTVTESTAVDGEDADAGDGGDGAGGTCIGICGGNGGGDGGDGETSPGSTALAAIAYPVYMSADLIIHVEDVSINNETLDETTAADQEGVSFGVAVAKNSVASVAIEGAAQSDLAALVVNNVAGKNLIANAINIAAGNITLGDGVVGHFLGQAGQATMGGQINVINQYRGTPINAPTPAVVGAVTPTGCGVAGAGGLFSC